jgi:NADH dehydrogenase
MTAPIVTVFGGSGFIGRYLVAQLARRGWQIRVAVRHPRKARFLQPLGDVGQITFIQAPLQDAEAISAALAGADAAVNLVGLLYERGRQSFGATHVEGARLIAEAAAAQGLKRLVQVSAIGADPRAEANYARSKAAGEAAVKAAFPKATILRPSIVFGAEDGFFNRFAAMARLSPALPLIGGGETKFQPVYVGDVAEAIAEALERDEAAGKTYELGGPGVYSFKELMAFILKTIGKRRFLVPVPFALADFEASFLEWLPVPPLTRDQVKLLKRDNVVTPGALGLADLGVRAQGIEALVPRYLARHRGGKRMGGAIGVT